MYWSYLQLKKKPPLAVRQHPGADINEISNSGFPLGMIRAQLAGKVKMCIKKDFALRFCPAPVSRSEAGILTPLERNEENPD